eukprot:15139-Heterococcus_DN1.PRE.3
MCAVCDVHRKKKQAASNVHTICWCALLESLRYTLFFAASGCRTHPLCKSITHVFTHYCALAASYPVDLHYYYRMLLLIGSFYCSCCTQTASTAAVQPQLQQQQAQRVVNSAATVITAARQQLLYAYVCV